MKYHTGALKNLKDNRDIKYKDIPVVATAEVLPTEHITDISMIPVLDQKQLGTCVAHVIAQIKMYQEYKETGKVKRFSRRYLYTMARQLSAYTLDMGLYPRDGAKALEKNGDIPTDSQDDNTLNHTEYLRYSPSVEEKEDAKKYRAGYAGIDSKDITTLKKAIIREGVVALALDFDEQAWYTDTLKPCKSASSRHYILIYGYKVTSAGTEVYFRNSWGLLWGNNGNGKFIWEQYAGHVNDILAFADVPNDLIEKAKDTQYIFTTTMKEGMTSPEVKKLQQRLRTEKFFDYPEDTGYFGKMTKEAVIAYQKAHSIIPASGIVGPLTRAELNKPVKKNA